MVDDIKDKVTSKPTCTNNAYGGGKKKKKKKKKK